MVTPGWAGPRMLKVNACDVNASEALATVICAVPALATSAAKIWAPRTGPENVVERGEPFQDSTASVGKGPPDTCSVKPGLPAFTDDGLRDEMEKPPGGGGGEAGLVPL